MNRSKTFTAFAFFLIFGLWIYSFLHVPTYDLDEALYRRVAEEMKWNGDFWHPVWDGRPLHHKPPFYYWLIAIFSWMIDGKSAGVSLLAARLPNLVATLGILFSIARFVKKPGESIWKPFQESLLLWGCTLLPLLTTTAVLFDPIQTLFLLPCLLVPHRAFSEKRSIQRSEYLWMGVSMFAATVFKGLNGLILPSIAIALHTLISNWKSAIPAGLRFFTFSFLPASFFSALMFFFLDQKIGRGFTEEFFLVHHFGRGTQAMEAHGGPVYYHWVVTLIGGGLLLPYGLDLWMRTRTSYRQWGFPMSFAIGTILFFTISVTKLPHYTWPIWPALVLQTLTFQYQTTLAPNGRRFPVWKIMLAPIAIVGIAIFALILNPEWIPQVDMNEFEVLLLSAAATFCVVVPWVYEKFMKQVEYLAFFNAMITLLIAVPLASITERIFVTPMEETVQAFKNFRPQAGDCIWYTGPMSATLSLIMTKELGGGIYHNRCEPVGMKFLISPNSGASECQKRKMSVLHEGKTLTLCGQI